MRKQIKNKRKLYKASLVLPDKSEKVLGWFRTRDEATHNANIMKEKHERVVAIRLKAKTQMFPSEDEIKNDCSAEVESGNVPD